jgi:hypothetical protein
MKPNNFPLRPSLDGTEELYTQTGGVSQKFTLETTKEFITAPTDITYSELYNKIINEELVAGSWYRLTDYRSVNFLNGANIANSNPTPVVPSFNPREVVMGDETEVLLLQAISSYEISPIGYSETFAQDIVTYLPLVNKIGVNISIQNGLVLSDGILNTIVSGFDLQWDGTNVYFNMPSGYPALYGHYFYLSAQFGGGSYYIQGTYEPLNLNGICQYPNGWIMPNIKLENNGTKVVLLGLTEQYYLDYNVGTLYVDTVYSLGDAYGWVTRRQDTQNRIDVPFDFRWIKYRRYECEALGNITSVSYSISAFFSAADNTYNNLSPNSDTSTDGQNATFNVTVSGGIVADVVINNSGRLYAIGDTLTIDGSQIGGVSGADDVVITIDSINSNIGYWGIGDVFNGANTTGNFKDSLSIDWTKWNIYNLEIDGQGGADANNYNGYCENNVFLSFVNNCKIGNYFQNNTISGNFYYNTIETQFQGNTIFGNFGYNTIGDAFIFNTIGDKFDNNTIGDSFQSNTIGDNFGGNTIGLNFASNTIGINFYQNNIGNGFASNTIGLNFAYNTIGGSFQSNTIGDGFNQNIIGDTFNSNTIVNDFQSNTIGNEFNNNTIGNNSINNTIGDSFQFNTIGANFNINTIGGSFASNSIGDRFQSNTIGDGFNQNTIGVDFQTNTIGISFGGNAIGNNFSNNTIGISSGNNTIGINFANNSIGISFQSNSIGDNSQSNTIGNGFNNNTIGESFNSNKIGDGFGANTIGDYFNTNTIGNSFQNNTIVNDFRWNTIKYSVLTTDFSLATHVYADYNCEIFKRSDNTLRLSYIDGSDTIQYAAITA